ncbi:MAG: hypothetical protein H6Q13_543 [Bacteroidetes bacterium]|jgi:hypothetical protein|nr:hypothetical protein [Bacteroidota bacterium]
MAGYCTSGNSSELLLLTKDAIEIEVPLLAC